MKNKKILIRFGEISLKGKNKMNFVNILANNIKNICEVNKEDIIIKINRIYLQYSKNYYDKLKFVFGITSYSIVTEIKTNMKLIEKELMSIIQKEKTFSFKVETKRKDKNFSLNSMEINRHLGSYIVENSSYYVDIHKPEIIIGIEIDKNFTYLFTSKKRGLGGMPVGSAGRVLHLISGGIDSPVAAYLMMKRGVKIDYLSFLTPPHTDEKTINKVSRIIELLNKYQGKSYCYSFDYSSIMNYISLTSNPSYKITLMRRSFYRIASKIAEKKNYLGISNGENLGQVASQTLESMQVIQKESSFPIYRPLLSFDKNETILIAKELGTYEISIEKAIEACELFAPKKPVTKPNIETCINLEKELKRLQELENAAIKENIEYKKYDLN